VIDHLAILAPGLLGASVAKAARARDAARHITIWARRPETRAALRAQPWADAIAETPCDAARNAQLIILAAPVEKIIELAAQIAPALKPGAIVTDVGSVKTRICRECAAAMPPHAAFIGSHPMAGSAKTGWENATADLFIGRTAFVTPPPVQPLTPTPAPPPTPTSTPPPTQIPDQIPTHPPAQLPAPLPSQTHAQLPGAAPAPGSETALVCEFWKNLGATPIILTPAQHDEIVAHISHLPQALATTLATLLGAKNPAWRAYAGNGLRDTTRIAASDATMWIEIFRQNRAEILRALEACETELASLHAALATEDWPQLRARLEAGKKFRDSL
jgi:cyclohexadieny/prephenate dehydrogenase